MTQDFSAKSSAADRTVPPFNVPAKTVGLLHAGEMGAAVAALLSRRGVRVVSTLGGRGEQTARRCRDAGIEVLPSLDNVVAASDIVISIVPPAAAREVVEEYCRLSHLAPAGALYVDANSIGPELAVELSARIEESGVGFVDAAINGLAKNLATTCTLFLSGPRASEIADIVGDAMKVRLLGERPGRASAMKMLLSGLSKGVCALFVETALTAHRHGMLSDMIAAYNQIYPGVMGIVERMLPTYAQHAGRRADEMRELEQTVHAAGLEPCMLAAAREMHELLAAANYGPQNSVALSVLSVIERLAAGEVLTADASAQT